MRSIIVLSLFLASGGIAFAQDTCSAPSIDDITHQGARLQYTSTGADSFHRLRYGTVSGTYTLQQGSANTPALATPNIVGGILSNLTSGTAYFGKAESSPDGTTWCTAPEFTLTTLALPSPHPAFPVQPILFNTSTPPTVTGIVCAATDAASFQSCLNTVTFGDEITIPAGTIITPGTALNSTFTTPDAPDSTAISSVDLSSGTFTTATTHGFSVNQAVRLGNFFFVPSPINQGLTYYIKTVPTTTSFTVSQTLGGATVAPLLDSGLGTSRVMAWPNMQTHYVIIRTTAPDAQLPPPGVRIDPAAYAASLATIRNSTPAPSIYQAINFGTLAHNYWFIGIKFDTTSTSTPGQNTDPFPFARLLNTQPQNFNIVADRDYLHCLGYPDRCSSIWNMDGTNISLINSSVDGATYWRPYITGFSPITTTATTVNLPAGVFHLGNAACTNASTLTATLTGGTSSVSAYLYYTMGCVLTLNLPTGMTATGTGFSFINSTTPAWPVDGNGSTAAGQLAIVSLSGGSITGVTTNAISSAYNSEGDLALTVTRGPGSTKIDNNYIDNTGIAVFWSDDASMNGGCQGAPGTSTFCPLLYTPANGQVTRNILHNDQHRMAGGPISDGRAYSNRNTGEQKTGSSMVWSGNQCLNNWAEINQGPCFAFNTNASNTPVGISSINYVSDIELSYNTMFNSAELFLLGGNQGPARFLGKTFARVWVHDNLAYLNNGWLSTANYPKAIAPNGAHGQFLSTGMGVEDMQFDHNTVYDSRGTFSVMAQFQNQMADGQSFKNNLLFTNLDGGNAPLMFISAQGDCGGTSCASATVPDYNGFAGTNLINVWGVGSAWDHNVILAGYLTSGPAGSEVPMAQSDVNTLAATFTASPLSIFPSGAGVSARTTAVGWYAALLNNFRLKFNTSTGISNYISGGSIRATNGTDIGANIDRLEAAQNVIGNVRAFSIGTTTATVAWNAYGIGYSANPDSCPSIDYVLQSTYASDGNLLVPGHYTRVTNSSTGIAQAVALTGLTSARAYVWRPNCSIGPAAGVGTFTTH